MGVTPFELCWDFRYQKTRVPGIFCGIVCVILLLAISVEHRLVTDGQTDSMTDTRRYLIPVLASVKQVMTLGVTGAGTSQNGTTFFYLKYTLLYTLLYFKVHTTSAKDCVIFYLKICYFFTEFEISAIFFCNPVNFEQQLYSTIPTWEVCE